MRCSMGDVMTRGGDGAPSSTPTATDDRGRAGAAGGHSRRLAEGAVWAPHQQWPPNTGYGVARVVLEARAPGVLSVRDRHGNPTHGGGPCSSRSTKLQTHVDVRKEGGNRLLVRRAGEMPEERHAQAGCRSEHEFVVRFRREAARHARAPRRTRRCARRSQIRCQDGLDDKADVEESTAILLASRVRCMSRWTATPPCAWTASSAAVLLGHRVPAWPATVAAHMRKRPNASAPHCRGVGLWAGREQSDARVGMNIIL